MKKQQNLGGVRVALRKGEEVEIVMANVKILEFKIFFQGPSDQPEFVILKDDMWGRQFSACSKRWLSFPRSSLLSFSAPGGERGEG